MGMAAWILFCMFASIGLVQCGFWLADAFGGRDRTQPLYHVIPVYDEPEQVEARVRSSLASLRKHRTAGEAVLIVDMGLKGECRQICDRLACEDLGAYICEKERLAAVIEEFENQRL